MSLRDNDITVVSIVATAVISGALFALMVYLRVEKVEEKPDLTNENVIEATIAYKKVPKAQPQKEFKPPDPVEKPVGVNHDDKAKPVDPKKDEPKKKPDDKSVDQKLKQYQHPDDDTPTGPLTKPTVGDLNGAADGNAAVSKGDPFFARLNRDMHYQPPAIAKGDSVPVGCILLSPDGKITDYKFKVKTDDDLQIAAEASLRGLQKIRNETPEEVPTNLLHFTEHYLCFKFTITPP